ncbi:hypothetical protein M569_12319, partial [Genlisea aurea]
DEEDAKLRWLQSQIIGVDAEFDSPFGRRRIVYADHTASGRSLRYIEEHIQTKLLPFYGNTHTSDSHVGKRTTEIVQRASKYVKHCLGGSEEDALIFCGSGSTAAIKRLQEVIGIGVPSILRERFVKCLSDDERWAAIVGPYEHHSNLLSWRQSLAEVVEIGADADGSIDMADLEQKLRTFTRPGRERPIIASFSACSNITGLVTDTRAVARMVHQFGGFVCFDFAASGPYVKIEMRSGEMDGYDAIFLSTHKFIGGPGSPGILLISKPLYQLRSSPPSTSGGGTVQYVNGYDQSASFLSNTNSHFFPLKDTLYIDDIEEREDAGMPAIIGKTRAAMAFWVKEYVGYDAINRIEQSYIRRAMERLLPNGKVKILGNAVVERQAILSFLVCPTAVDSTAKSKPLDGAFVAKLMNDLFGIHARGGCACAGPYGHTLLDIDERTSKTLRSIIKKGYVGVKPGWTRVSFPYYMPTDEFEFILSAIEFIAAFGQRFLVLYSFDWKTGAWTFEKNELTIHIIINTTTATHLKSDPDRVAYEIHRDDDLSRERRIYLETANRIAQVLSESPPQRKTPDDIASDAVFFRV